jgi:hypothetical protein
MSATGNMANTDHMACPYCGEIFRTDVLVECDCEHSCLGEANESLLVCPRCRLKHAAADGGSSPYERRLIRELVASLSKVTASPRRGRRVAAHAEPACNSCTPGGADVLKGFLCAPHEASEFLDAVQAEDRCPYCNGSGVCEDLPEIERQKCPDCNGTGTE